MRGFTIIEMVIVIAITSTFMAMAAPSFSKMINKGHLISIADELQGTLFSIRSEALKRRQNVYLCALNAAEDGCAIKGDIVNFNNGWLSYIDCNNDGEYASGALTCDLEGDGSLDSEELIKIWPLESSAGITIQHSRNSIRYRYKMSGRSSAASFCITKKGLTTTKKIIIANTGRIRSSTQESSCLK